MIYYIPLVFIIFSLSYYILFLNIFLILLFKNDFLYFFSVYYF